MKSKMHSLFLGFLQDRSVIEDFGLLLNPEKLGLDV